MPSHNRHRSFFPHVPATSVCMVSSHPELPLHLVIFTVLYWTVFLSWKHSHPPDHHHFHLSLQCCLNGSCLATALYNLHGHNSNSVSGHNTCIILYCTVLPMINNIISCIASSFHTLLLYQFITPLIIPRAGMQITKLCLHGQQSDSNSSIGSQQSLCYYSSCSNMLFLDGSRWLLVNMMHDKSSQGQL